MSTLVEHLDRTRVVAVVSRRADGSETAAPIWAVVVGGEAYVRAAYGKRTAWYRRALAGEPVAFSLADGALAEADAEAALRTERASFTAEFVPVDDPVQERISAAFSAKYGDEPDSLAYNLRAPATECTLRIIPD